MNAAAWLMVVLQRPYRIVDRVILGGLIGDVKDITISYILLEQVGGTRSLVRPWFSATYPSRGGGSTSG